MVTTTHASSPSLINVEIRQRKKGQSKSKIFE